MSKKKPVRKYEKIKNVHNNMMVVTSICLFITVANIVPMIKIGQKIAYNNQLINKKTEANDNLKDNLNNLNKLKKEINVLRTNKMLLLDNNRINSDQNPVRVVADALPDRANSVALGSSLRSKILENGASIKGMTIVADEEEMDEETPYKDLSYSRDSQDISAGTLSFNIELIGNKEKLVSSFYNLERTIRPMQISNLELKGSEGGELTVSIRGQTYFQKKQDFKSLIQRRKLEK